MTTVLKGIKLRLYPNKQQQAQLWQMFGNDRFVWNQMLDMAKQRYQNNPSSQFVDQYSMDALLKPLKQEYPFLKRSDSTSLQVVNHNLYQAFQRLFKHLSGYPRFKSRRSAKQSYTGKSKIGYIKTSKTRQLTHCKIKRYTVSYDPSGRYYLSLQVETTVQPLPKTSQQVGIDVGVTNLAVTSDGHKYAKFDTTWLTQQAQHWQSKYSRRCHQATVSVRQWNHNHQDVKEELNDYQNWQRARIQKARYQRRVADQRRDYLHKLTMALVTQYDMIVIEDLKVKNLQKNHHLAAAIVNASWHQFRTMLEYKCDWYGKQLITVKPNYTSQICSHCDYYSGAKPLAIREWTCPKCGVHHDRDINAAINILHKGLKAVG